MKKKFLRIMVLLAAVITLFPGCQLNPEDSEVTGPGELQGSEINAENIETKAPNGIAYDVYYEVYCSQGIQGPLSWQEGTDEDEVGKTSDNWYMMGFAVDIKSLGFDIEYRTHFGGHSWNDWEWNGSWTPMYTGTATKKLQIRLINAPSNYHIEYKIHVKKEGWSGWYRDGQTAEEKYLLGTARRKINAVKIRLVGPAKKKCSAVGSYDGANCYIGKAPSGTKAFIYNDNFYYTPLPGNKCPYPGSGFDGANCFVMDIPTGAHPFIWNNGWYVKATY